MPSRSGRPRLAAGLAGLLLVCGGLMLQHSRPHPPTATAGASDSTDLFMWTGATHMLDHDPLLFRTKLAFAARQGIIPYESGMNDAGELRRFLRACREVGIERTWIEIGPDDGVSAKAFATDSTARRSTLNRFRALARAYKGYAPESAPSIRSGIEQGTRRMPVPNTSTRTTTAGTPSSSTAFDDRLF